MNSLVQGNVIASSVVAPPRRIRLGLLSERSSVSEITAEVLSPSGWDGEIRGRYPVAPDIDLLSRSRGALMPSVDLRMSTIVE